MEGGELVAVVFSLWWSNCCMGFYWAISLHSFKLNAYYMKDM